MGIGISGIGIWSQLTRLPGIAHLSLFYLSALAAKLTLRSRRLRLITAIAAKILDNKQSIMLDFEAQGGVSESGSLLQSKARVQRRDFLHSIIYKGISCSIWLTSERTSTQVEEIRFAGGDVIRRRRPERISSGGRKRCALITCNLRC